VAVLDKLWSQHPHRRKALKTQALHIAYLDLIRVAVPTPPKGIEDVLIGFVMSIMVVVAAPHRRKASKTRHSHRPNLQSPARCSTHTSKRH